jgi:Met-zincin/Domain of unknown function (DUF5117)
MKPAMLPLLFALVSAYFPANAQTVASAEKETPSVTSRTSGLQKHEGFIPYYWDEKKGGVLFELSPATLNREFLYFTGMGSGIGSPELFADRSSFGDEALCRFRRVGMRVLAIEENSRFRATHGSTELAQSVDSSFPTSIVASLPIEAEQDGTVLVNANGLLIRDAFDLISQMRQPTQVTGGTMVRGQVASVNWRVDENRSVVDLDHSGSFPLNTEMEALLTFTTESESHFNQPDAHALSVREHHSFVALPDPGYETREQDPRVGIDSEDFEDFSQPFDQPLMRHLVRRWRLQKKDPSAPLSEPAKPIVFYLDRAIPEPMRSAARRGILLWNAAFEQAGFKDAIRVEDLPAGANPMDVRYSTVQWTNRSGRGWSVGQTQADLRTGELIHAVVQLDSHRMRTMNNYWESLIPSGRDAEEPALDTFAALDNLDPQVSAEQVMLNRIAALTCHEIGHALGLPHNFVASTYGRGSVMDYFAPRVKIRADGSADLSDAYMQELGSYDRFVIEWGYSEGTPGNSQRNEAEERKRLNAMVTSAISKGIVWGNYDDPRWNAYDDGPDPVTWLKEVWPVRDALLAHYGPQMLRPGEPNSLLASRFPLIYLFHRYALAAAIKVIGSATVPLSVAGDGQKPVNIFPVNSQKEALRLVLRALNPSELKIPPALWSALAPTENRGRDPESFMSSAGYLFSPQDGARAVADVVVGGLLDPQRMERLAVIADEDPGALSQDAVISAVVRSGFSADARTPAEKDLAGVVQSEIAEHLMILASDGEATPEVRAAALAGVNNVNNVLGATQQSAMARRLKHEIALYLQNPKENAPKLKTSGAPVGPPV